MKLFVEYCKKSKLCLLNLDHTGSIIKKFEQQKPALLKSIILNTCSVSVCDFVITNNQSFATEKELSRFLASTRTLRKMAVFPDVVVTDFSYAPINACTSSFNKMTLPRYLEIVYKVMINRAEKLKESSVDTINGICHCHIVTANRLV